MNDRCGRRGSSFCLPRTRARVSTDAAASKQPHSQGLSPKEAGSTPPAQRAAAHWRPSFPQCPKKKRTQQNQGRRPARQAAVHRPPQRCIQQFVPRLVHAEFGDGGRGRGGVHVLIFWRGSARGGWCVFFFFFFPSECGDARECAHALPLNSHFFLFVTCPRGPVPARPHRLDGRPAPAASAAATRPSWLSGGRGVGGLPRATHRASESLALCGKRVRPRPVLPGPPPASPSRSRALTALNLRQHERPQHVRAHGGGWNVLACPDDCAARAGGGA